MLALLLILRLVHVLAGVFWAGSSFVMTGFVEPTVRGAGDDGRRFMGRFASQSGFTTVILIASSSTVAAGLWLWWIVSDGLSRAWLETGRGTGLTLGILAASIGYVVGYLMQYRPIRRLVAIGGRVAASGGPPSPEQAEEMTRLTGTVRKGGSIVSVLLLIAVSLMATARYLPSF